MNRKRKPDSRKRPEPSQISSNAAQRSYKDQRRANGKMYTQAGGHKNKASGAPYSTDVKPFGTDKYRFEEVLEVDPEGFQINDELEPRIWKDEKLRPFISKKLMQIAEDFIDGLPFTVVIQDVRFTGSLANYNWSKYSDIDLHIVVDFTELDENKELVKEMFDAKRLRWNEKHDITIKGYEVELYVEDVGEEHSSSGIYSVMEGEWVNHPKRVDRAVDLDTAEKKASDIEQQITSIDAMFDRGQFEKVIKHVDRLKKKIRNMRQAGLDSEAMEFSPENIAFKLLRRNELLDTLTKLKYKAYDQSMTLDD
jgi:predicted nucleotidyltransferase